MDEVIVERNLDEAERKAQEALAGYKFMMFGYWAAIWVHLNHIGKAKRRNPFQPYVKLAKERIKDGASSEV